MLTIKNFCRGVRKFEVCPRNFKVAVIKKPVLTIHKDLARNDRSITMGLRFTNSDLCMKTPLLLSVTPYILVQIH